MRTLTTDVAIIGAGLSGLAAADALASAGVDAVVLDARGRAGGRVGRIEADGFPRPYDSGGQFIFDVQETLLELLAKYGLQTEPAFLEGDFVRHVGGERTVFHPAKPFADEATGAAVGAAFEQLGQMAATFTSGSPWTAPDAAAWDSQTFRTWTLEHVPDPEARFALEARLANALGGNPGQLSLLAVLDFIQSTGGPGLPPKFLAVAGGMYRLADAMAGALGERLLLDAPVSAVRQTDGGVEVTSAEAIVEARAVIAAFSPALLDRITFEPGLPLRRRLLARRWLEVPGTKAVLIYERPFWRDDGLCGMGSGDLPAANFVQDHTAPGQEQGVLVCFYNAGESADWELLENAELRAHTRLESLEKLFGPEAGRPLAVGECNWLADDWSAGCSYGLFPGVWTGFGPILREPVGRVLWAGTDTAEQWQGSVEGAARAGRRAATEAARIVTG